MGIGDSGPPFHLSRTLGTRAWLGTPPGGGDGGRGNSGAECHVISHNLWPDPPFLELREDSIAGLYGTLQFAKHLRKYYPPWLL